MDTTIRNLDEDTYRRFKGWAAREGKTMGQALTDAMEAYLIRNDQPRRRRNFWDLPTTPGGPDAGTSSEDVDKIVYGK